MAYETVYLGREALITDGVKRIEMVGGHPVGEFLLFGVLLGEDMIVYLGIKIAIGSQQVTCHQSTHFRVDMGHEHGFLTKMIHHPFAELGGGIGIMIIDSQFDFQGIAQ